MKVTKENFLKSVANHNLEVLLDNGLYRHLKVMNPKSSNQWYQIVTWKGYLSITGDMGDYVFARCDDMFNFFRRKDLVINAGYYAEKIQAGVDYRDAQSTYSGFDIDLAHQHVNEYIENSIEEGESPSRLKEKFEDVLSSNDEYEYVTAIRETDIDLCDWPNCESLKPHYIWCCYAIAHAINLYDQQAANN